MFKEAQDFYQLLSIVHQSVDKLVVDLSDEEWVNRPGEGFNTIAGLIEHMARVEEKFFSALTGTVKSMDVMEPLKKDSWDVAAIKTQWAALLEQAESVLSQVKPEQLDNKALTIGVGDLTGRQTIAYAIAHTTHHRGQIPLLKRLIRG